MFSVRFTYLCYATFSSNEPIVKLFWQASFLESLSARFHFVMILSDSLFHALFEYLRIVGGANTREAYDLQNDPQFFSTISVDDQLYKSNRHTLEWVLLNDVIYNKLFTMYFAGQSLKPLEKWKEVPKSASVTPYLSAFDFYFADYGLSAYLESNHISSMWSRTKKRGLFRNDENLFYNSNNLKLLSFFTSSSSKQERDYLDLGRILVPWHAHLFSAMRRHARQTLWNKNGTDETRHIELQNDMPVINEQHLYYEAFSTLLDNKLKWNVIKTNAPAMRQYAILMQIALWGQDIGVEDTYLSQKLTHSDRVALDKDRVIVLSQLLSETTLSDSIAAKSDSSAEAFNLQEKYLRAFCRFYLDVLKLTKNSAQLLTSSLFAPFFRLETIVFTANQSQNAKMLYFFGTSPISRSLFVQRDILGWLQEGCLKIIPPGDFIWDNMEDKENMAFIHQFQMPHHNLLYLLCSAYMQQNQNQARKKTEKLTFHFVDFVHVWLRVAMSVDFFTPENILWFEKTFHNMEGMQFFFNRRKCRLLWPELCINHVFGSLDATPGENNMLLTELLRRYLLRLKGGNEENKNNDPDFDAIVDVFDPETNQVNVKKINLIKQVVVLQEEKARALDGLYFMVSKNRRMQLAVRGFLRVLAHKMELTSLEDDILRQKWTTLFPYFADSDAHCSRIQHRKRACYNIIKAAQKEVMLTIQKHIYEKYDMASRFGAQVNQYKHSPIILSDSTAAGDNIYNINHDFFHFQPFRPKNGVLSGPKNSEWASSVLNSAFWDDYVKKLACLHPCMFDNLNSLIMLLKMGNGEFFAMQEEDNGPHRRLIPLSCIDVILGTSRLGLISEKSAGYYDVERPDPKKIITKWYYPDLDPEKQKREREYAEAWRDYMKKETKKAATRFLVALIFSARISDGMWLGLLHNVIFPHLNNLAIYYEMFHGLKTSHDKNGLKSDHLDMMFASRSDPFAHTMMRGLIASWWLREMFNLYNDHTYMVKQVSDLLMEEGCDYDFVWEDPAAAASNNDNNNNNNSGAPKTLNLFKQKFEHDTCPIVATTVVDQQTKAQSQAPAWRKHTVRADVARYLRIWYAEKGYGRFCFTRWEVKVDDIQHFDTEYASSKALPFMFLNFVMSSVASKISSKLPFKCSTYTFNALENQNSYPHPLPLPITIPSFLLTQLDRTDTKEVSERFRVSFNFNGRISKALRARIYDYMAVRSDLIRYRAMWNQDMYAHMLRSSLIFNTTSFIALFSEHDRLRLILAKYHEVYKRQSESQAESIKKMIPSQITGVLRFSMVMNLFERLLKSMIPAHVKIEENPKIQRFLCLVYQLSFFYRDRRLNVLDTLDEQRSTSRSTASTAKTEDRVDVPNLAECLMAFFAFCKISFLNEKREKQQQDTDIQELWDELRLSIPQLRTMAEILSYPSFWFTLPFRYHTFWASPTLRANADEVRFTIFREFLDVEAQNGGDAVVGQPHGSEKKSEKKKLEILLAYKPKERKGAKPKEEQGTLITYASHFIRHFARFRAGAVDSHTDNDAFFKDLSVYCLDEPVLDEQVDRDLLLGRFFNDAEAYILHHKHKLYEALRGANVASNDILYAAIDQEQLVSAIAGTQV